MTLFGESSLEGQGQGAIVRQLPVISSVSQHENQGFPLFLPPRISTKSENGLFSKAENLMWDNVNFLQHRFI